MRICVAQHRRHRGLEIEPVGRDRRFEPLLVNRLDLRASVKFRGRTICHGLEGCIILAQHDTVGFGLGEGFFADNVGGRVLRSCDRDGELHVIENIGGGAAGLQHEKCFRLVLCGQRRDAEITCAIHLIELYHVGRARHRDNRFAFEVVDRSDVVGFSRGKPSCGQKM